MIDNNFVKIEVSARTMLTIKQTIATFRDVDGRPVFTDYMIRTLIRDGKIPHVRLGNRKILLCKETIENWLTEQEKKSMIRPIETNRFGLRKL